MTDQAQQQTPDYESTRRPKLPIQIKKMRDGVVLPEYGTAGAAGLDLRAMLDSGMNSIVLLPGEQKLVGTGIAVQFDQPGFASFILPRSSTGAKLGIVLGNLVALIDEDYTGEIMLMLWNRGTQPRTIEHMERVAQLVIMPVMQVHLCVVDQFHRDTERGAGGFGSTGKA